MAEKLEAIVEFDYKAQESDELTIKKGDTIHNIKQLPGGWWEGTLASTGMRGMFPDNFVKVLETGASTMDSSKRKGSVRRCRVLFSYQPANEDELELGVGEHIEILDEVEEGWWKGRINSQVGVFPSNFVVEVFDDVPESKEASHRKASKSSYDGEASNGPSAVAVMNHYDLPSDDSQVPELPPKPVREQCLVLYAYDAVNDDELTLREGEIITLVSRECQDKGWWRGELNGRLGVFPDNFVQVITPEETNKSARPPSKTSSTTTNRVKDSINRSTAPQITAHRKSLEIPQKPEEKLSPPGVSKKPALPPPPLKKPQKSTSGTSVNKTLAASQSTPSNLSVSLISPSTSTSTSQTSLNTLTVSQNNVIKPAESISSSAANISLSSVTLGPKHITDTSVKPTDSTDGGCMSRNVTDGGAMSRSTGSMSLETDADLDSVERTAMLTHPTASRVRAPRRRPPSVMFVKEMEEEQPAMVNGMAEHHFTIPEEAVLKAPWVEELKMNQAKKSAAQGKTRVIISGGEQPPTSPTPPEPLKVSPGPVTLRSAGGGGTSRPQSMFSSRSFSLSPSSPDSITVSHRQWTELNEKVQRLEGKLESQHDWFTRTISELTAKLDEEAEKRLRMETELAKLANFVTQV